MKIAFSTLGCPGWSWDEIYATGKDLGYDGIEVRGIANEMFAPKAKPFLPDHLQETKAKLTGNIRISMLTTGACVGVTEQAEAGVAEAKAYIDLAQKLDVPYIRVMVSPEPGPTDADLNLAVKKYGEICGYAEGKGVIPLIETNGILADSEIMKSFLAKIDSKNCGVLWDINHPVRFYNEEIDVTYGNLADAIKYVHIKDSIVKDGKIQYRMMGYGDLPIYDVVALLNSHDFDSYLSLEWVKRWNPDLQEPGIVFSHFITYIHYLKNAIDMRK